MSTLIYDCVCKSLGHKQEIQLSAAAEPPLYADLACYTPESILIGQ